ncbi:uncharacterized protein (TIGR02594 family) [Chitinivorax tropicus]|uniref:Uncharacterized protein (TIGR02594 family) n=1 Tax=Chitinivorax tropicus TaxID=714531 RepID=A0A840MQ87_9PROT|nr:TIGR02594 family protein [Chitinivorax tropicus]MBB5020600.1 uncharacterized protein (TIGR02594 family) [Chitinivorax tropicus]
MGKESIRNSGASVPVYDAVDKKQADACKPNQINAQSNADEPISHQHGELSGRSRAAGDISEDVRRIIIDMIIDEAVRRGHSHRDIAIILLIARLESGFNPDAAACSTSASGIGQFTDKTAMEILRVTSTSYWRKNNPLHADIDITKIEDRFNARKNIIAMIILYELCKKISCQVMASSPDEIECRIYQYYHKGIYFDAILENKKVKYRVKEKIDTYGQEKFAAEIQPYINKVVLALQKQTKVQFALKQPNGQPVAKAEYVAIVPKKPLTTVEDRDHFFGWIKKYYQKASSYFSPSPSAPKPPTPQPTAPNQSTARPVGAAQQAKVPVIPPQSYPPRVKDSDKFAVITGKTDGQGLTQVISAPGTAEIYMCILEMDYDEKAIQRAKQAEEHLLAPALQSTHPADQSADPPIRVEDGNATPAESKLPDDGLAPAAASSPDSVEAQPSEQDLAHLQQVADEANYAFPTPKITSLYCDRQPNMQKVAEALKKEGKLFDSFLIEHARSYVVKPTQELTQAANMATTSAGKVNVIELSSNKVEKQEKRSQPAAQVTTANGNPAATAQSNAKTPWMDIALKERYQRAIPSTVQSSAEGKALLKAINEYAASIKDLKKQLKKLDAKKQQAEIEKVKQEIDGKQAELNKKLAELETLQTKYNNPRIVEYIKTTDTGMNLVKTNKPVDDEIAWCASFVNWCLVQAGVKTHNSARAADWGTFGVEAPEGTYGAIVWIRFTSSNKSGAVTLSGNHVGFLYMEDGNYLYMLGGNQKGDINNKEVDGVPKVSITRFPKNSISIMARKIPKVLL